METKTKTVAEYKAPRCKCVEIHIERSLLQDSTLLMMGSDNEAGDGVENNYGGSF